MKNKNETSCENRKVRYTKRVIKESFLELLESHPVDVITVKEIAERADINRSTFYAHYANMDALLAELENEMADHVIEAMEKLYTTENYEGEVVSAVFDALLQHKEMRIWLLDDKMTGSGSRKIYDYACRICVPRWMQEGGITQSQAEYFLTFIYNGCIGFLKDWYLQDFAGDCDERRDQFERIIHNTLLYIYG